MIARVFGILFLITFVTSIPAYFFYVPVLDDPRYIVGAGADTGVQWGAFLELLLIVANIGTAVVLYPIVRRQNEILALGYVTARLVDKTFPLSETPEAIRYLENGHARGKVVITVPGERA